MLQRLLSVIKRPTSRDVFINTVGNYFNLFFTALFALILVRILNPTQYGVLSVLLGIAYVLANILDFGTTATIYSYLPPLIEKKASNIYRFIKSTFYYQSLFSFAVLGLLFIFFPFLDKVFFKTSAPAWELYITCFSVLFLIWQNFITNIMNAAKKFLKVNIYSNLANVLKTIVILFMVYTKTVTVGSVIFVFGIVGPMLFFLLLFMEKKDLVFVLMKAEVKREEFRFGYTLTYFIASQFFYLGQRMDLFMLSYYRAGNNVGFYGLSQKIILSVITTVVSITQVLSPGFSKIKTKKDSKHQLKIGFFYMLLPVTLFAMLTIMPNFVFDILFTHKFNATAQITRVLSIPFVVYALGSVPMLFVLYTIKKPKFILVANILFFVTITLGSYLLIPNYGVFGPPVAIFVAMLLSSGILSYVAIKEYRKLPD